MKTFEEWCNDREIVLNELSPKLLAMAYKIWGEECFVEGQRYEAENAELRTRLEKAVELPCIEPMTTWDWDATTGLGKSNFGKYWKVVYRDEDGELMVYMGATKEEAKARLKELQEKNNE